MADKVFEQLAAVELLCLDLYDLLDISVTHGEVDADDVGNAWKCIEALGLDQLYHHRDELRAVIAGGAL